MERCIKGKQFDEERALYHAIDTEVAECAFAGPADGESVLKEARNILVRDTSFSLRYPMWHVKGFELTRCSMDELTRAALWYSEDGKISNCMLGGIKAVRECSRIDISNCEIVSQEFGWKSDYITLSDSEITAEYLFLDSHHVKLDRVHMKGKYSFQYMENVEINNCILDTKDAFWHSKNVIVRNSVVKGEYLGWFADGITFVDCKIIGTQPLCYCERLAMINCTMEQTDLAFEYSDVNALLVGHVDSIKNPKKGSIVLDSVGEVIHDDPIMECTGQIFRRPDFQS